MKILIFDIETAPNLAYVWGKYEQDVIEYENEWYMLCYAYKWFGEKKTQAVALPDFKSLYRKDKENDAMVVTTLWHLFDEADVVVAHNGDRFDIRKTNARFLAHGLLPPSPYKTVDTLKIARKYFAMNSNRLNDLGEHLGIGSKVETGGFKLWKGCMDGDKKAWNKMIKYNKQDVDLLDEVYTKMRGWASNHPNHNVVDETENMCPTCGGDNLQKRGYRTTAVGKRQAYQCQDCGKWSQGETIKITSVIKP